jgi:hypothetical protein
MTPGRRCREGIAAILPRKTMVMKVRDYYADLGEKKPEWLTVKKSTVKMPAKAPRRGE